jgi:DNA-binding transcriptional MerR regulator
MTGLKIGEVARRGGVNLETIRYYERERLLLKPPRLSSGYRMFPADAVHRVRFIKRAQELGFSLSEIRELLSCQLRLKIPHCTGRKVRHPRAVKVYSFNRLDENGTGW